MILSALGECRLVTGDAVEEAWGDLQQLPTPWQPGATPRDAAPGVVTVTPIFWTPASYSFPASYEQLIGQFLANDRALVVLRAPRSMPAPGTPFGLHSVII